MDRDDPGGKIAHVDLGEAGCFHHRLERGLVGMLADRFGQVLVALGIAGEEFAEPRQHCERMKIVQRLEQGRTQRGEFQDQDAAARLEHAMHLAKGKLFVSDIAQAEGDGDGIEAAIRKRQRFGVQLRIVQVAHKSTIQQTVAAAVQHRGIDVAEHDAARRADARQQQGGDVAGAAGQVQHMVTHAHAAGRREPAFPQPVHAERHQVVHQVVLARHRSEHPADKFFLVGERHVAVAEMRGRFVHGRHDSVAQGVA